MWNHHLSVTSPQGNTYQNSGRFSANWPPSISGRIKECLGPFDRSHLAQLTVGDILRSELIGAMLWKIAKKTLQIQVQRHDEMIQHWWMFLIFVAAIRKQLYRRFRSRGLKILWGTAMLTRRLWPCTLQNGKNWGNVNQKKDWIF